MKQIYTIQHTQSEHHINGMVGSWTDWDLTPLGVAQAERIGARLAAELRGRPAAVYTSDLRRARRTADIIAAHLGASVTACHELRERNLGRCVGHSVQWLRENMEKPERTIDDRLFPDAESRRDAWQRLRPCFDRLLADPAGCIVVVSHGDLLGLFHAMFLGLEAESLNRLALSGRAGSLSELILEEDGFRRVRRLFDLSFLA